MWGRALETVVAVLGGGCQAARAEGEDLACSRGVLEASTQPRTAAVTDLVVTTTPPMLVLIGLGGLGCPVLLSSLTSGVERLLLVDGDTVSTSNLQRQVLYRGASEGHPKVLAARRFIHARTPTTEVACVEQNLTESDLASLIATLPTDAVVLECSDTPTMKFAVNDACLTAGIPAVIGGVVQWRGTVLGVAPGQACYRCYFEEPPDPHLAPACETVGVLGPAAGLMGGWMTGVAWGLHADPPAHAGKLHAVDLRSLQPRMLRARPRADCPSCGDLPTAIAEARTP